LYIFKIVIKLKIFEWEELNELFYFLWNDS
jgi:hypothetical protein